MAPSSAPEASAVQRSAAPGAVEHLPGGNAHSPLANGAVPVLAVQGRAVQREETAPGGGGGGPTAPPLPPGAAERGLAWAKPKRSQSGNAQVWYLVPATEADTEKVELTAERRRYYIPNDAGLEMKAMAFERALGVAAMGSGGARQAASAMAGAVVTIMDDYVKFLREAGATVGTYEAEIGAVIGSTGEGFAGAVGTSEAALRGAAAKATGNVREQLAIATAFAWNFGKAFVDKQKNTEMQAFAESLKASRPLLSQALEQAVETGDSNLTGTLPQDTSANRREARTLIGQQKDMRTTTPEVDNRVAGSERTETVGGSMGEARTAAPDLMQGPVAALSPREARQMNGTPGASDAEALAAIEGQRLRWNEGIRRFILDESHPWVQTMRGANLPVGAGPSGTTKGVMEARQLLNVSNPLYARAAAIGYLLPINAHSLIEILIGAASVDGPAPVPQDFGVYLHVEPFNGKGLYQDEDFWKAVEATEAKNRGGGVG
jgi:hypothetical protein